MKGSEHNDPFMRKNIEKNDLLKLKESVPIKPKTNNAGGILGGISSGENIVKFKNLKKIKNYLKKKYFKVAFKPVSTIGKQQKTVDLAGIDCLLEEKGRHDPCVLPRASPIVESMAALVLMDCLLQQGIKYE